MSDFRFETREALYFLWVIPALYLFSVWYGRRVQNKLNEKLSEKLRPFLTSSLSTSRRRWKLRLQMLVVGFMLLAYARPQTGEGRQQVKNEGIELLFLVDVSNSMMAEDIRPSRIEFAKKELDRFVDLSPGDRMGLIAFAGSAALLSPMTTDPEAVKMYIDSLNVDSVSSQGTDFTKALNEAREAFRRGGMGDQEGIQVTRAILIASDGEDQVPGTYEAAKQLIADGIHIFTIGFGTEQGGAIPLRDDQGILRGYKRDKSGQVIMSQTKGTVLKELAQIGEGSFHHATFQGDAIQAIRADIAKLKKAQFESGEMRTYEENYQTLLVVALLIGLLELVLGERQRKGRIWQGRFEVAHD